jgi:hypothetical protein
MVYQMWIPMVHAAEWQARRAWEVVAVGQELVEARAQHLGQVALVKTLMSQATGPVNIAPLQISSRPPFVQCANNVGKSHFLLDWPPG